MLALARTRLPRAVACGDATSLPLADESVDAVVMVWLLHLLETEQVKTAIAEAARVLRPAGTLVTTVNKNDAVYAPGSDTTDLLGPIRSQFAPQQRDAADTIINLGKPHRIAPTAEATFIGHGQGRSPGRWIEAISKRDHDWTGAAGPQIIADLLRQLADLPDQDTPRAEPLYRLLALQRH
jgi:SAM-dependent methyltransferase